MQSCQETLTRNCATKAGTYQASPKVHIKVLEYLVQARVIDDVERITLDLHWAKKMVKDKTDDVIAQDSDGPRLKLKMPVGDTSANEMTKMRRMSLKYRK